MNSGKMFAALEGYRERKFFKEHPFIFFNTLQGEEKYQVFAVFSTPVYTGSVLPIIRSRKRKTESHMKHL